MTKEFSSGGGQQPHVRCHFHRPRPSATAVTAGCPHHQGLGPRTQGPWTVAFLPRPATDLCSDFVPLSAGHTGNMETVIGVTCCPAREQTRPAQQQRGEQQQQQQRNGNSCSTSGTVQQIPSFFGLDLAPAFLEELLRHSVCAVGGRPESRPHAPCCKGKSSACEDKVEAPTDHSVKSEASQLTSEQAGQNLSFTVQPDASKGGRPEPVLKQGHSKDQHSLSPYRKQDEDPTTWAHSMHGLGIFNPGEVTVKVKAGKVVVHARREKSCGPGTCLSHLEIVKAIPLPDNVEQQSLRCVLKADGTLQLTGQCCCPTAVDRKSEDECGLQNQQWVKKGLEKAENEMETSGPQYRETTKAETEEEQVPEAKEAVNNGENETYKPAGPKSVENEQKDGTAEDAVSFTLGEKPLAELANKSVTEINWDSSPSTTTDYEHAQVRVEGTTGGEVETAEAQSPIVEFPDNEDIESENELEMVRSFVSQSSVASDLEVISELFFDGCIEKDFQGTASHDESEQIQREAAEVFEDCDATPPLKRQSGVSECHDPRSGTTVDSERVEDNFQQSAYDHRSSTPVDSERVEDNLQQSAYDPRFNTPVDSKSAEDEMQQSAHDYTTPESTQEKDYQGDSATDCERAGDKLQQLDHGHSPAGSKHPNVAFRVSLPVMGFSPQDMQVKLKGSTLKFHARRHAVLGDAPYTEGLERVIELPGYLDTNTVQCHLREDGYLVITALPKPEDVALQIKVNV